MASIRRGSFIREGEGEGLIYRRDGICTSENREVSQRSIMSVLELEPGESFL